MYKYNKPFCVHVCTFHSLEHLLCSQMLFLPVHIACGGLVHSCTLILDNTIKRWLLPQSNLFYIYVQDGRTPLVLASNNGRNEVIQLLLNHGAKIDFPNVVSITANCM